MSIYPYVYWCTNRISGEFYIGYRSANKLPAEQDFPNYKTSSKKVRSTFDQFDWYIVAEFFDADAAYDFEQQLIHENWSNPLILNKMHFSGKKRFKTPLSLPDETRLKMSHVRKGKAHSTSARMNMTKSRREKSPYEYYTPKGVYYSLSSAATELGVSVDTVKKLCEGKVKKMTKHSLAKMNLPESLASSTPSDVGFKKVKKIFS